MFLARPHVINGVHSLHSLWWILPFRYRDAYRFAVHKTNEWTNEYIFDHIIAERIKLMNVVASHRNVQLLWFSNSHKENHKIGAIQPACAQCHNMPWEIADYCVAIGVQENKRFLLIAHWLAIRSAGCCRQALQFTASENEIQLIIQGHLKSEPNTFFVIKITFRLQSNGMISSQRPVTVCPNSNEWNRKNWAHRNRNISTDEKWAHSQAQQTNTNE